MSPSEFDLRAALHDGEGDVPDASLIMAKASRAHYERRRRIVAIASGAAAVAVVATGITLLARSGAREEGGAGGGDTAAAGAGAYPGAFQGSHRGAEPNSSATAGSGGSADKAYELACPKRFPQQALPGGGGTNQFGADEPLFNAPVAAMTVCVYGTETRSVYVDGSAAEGFASSLNSASGDDPLDCLRAEPDLAMYAVDSSGTQLRVVTATPGCMAYHVTNGTAERWVPFDEFGPVHLAGQTSPPANQGSPIKS